MEFAGTGASMKAIKPPHPPRPATLDEPDCLFKSEPFETANIQRGGKQKVNLTRAKFGNHRFMEAKVTPNGHGVRSESKHHYRVS